MLCVCVCVSYFFQSGEVSEHDAYEDKPSLMEVDNYGKYVKPYRHGMELVQAVRTLFMQVQHCLPVSLFYVFYCVGGGGM